jgi:hypothetical protein
MDKFLNPIKMSDVKRGKHQCRSCSGGSTPSSSYQRSNPNRRSNRSMSRIRKAQLAATAGLLACALSARADEGTLQNDQLALPAHKLVVNGFLETSLSKNAAFKPVSISPDIWYGATDEVTLGLVHSSVGSTGFVGGVSDSLCLTGKKNGCRHPYPNVGADVRYRLASPFVLDAGIFIRDTDPFQVAVKIGADARWRFDRLTIEVLPSLFFGLNKRSKGIGNKDWLYVPVTVSYEIVNKLELAIQTGVALQWEKAGDNYRIPVALAGRYQVTEKLGLGLAFALPSLIAPSTTDATTNKKTPRGFDVRTLVLGGSYAF